jgi:hypothetical protein
LHYGDSLECHNMLLPAWTMERKHKEVTAMATRIQNLKFFEDSLYTEILPPAPQLRVEPEASECIGKRIQSTLQVEGIFERAPWNYQQWHLYQ